MIDCQNPLWKANIALRDYLRANTAARDEYAAAKTSAVAQGSGRLLAYSAAKSVVLERLLARALELR